MNSKPLVFAVFAIWSILCWRWYVCGLMNACDSTPEKEMVVAIPDPQADTLLTATETPEIQPLDNANSKHEIATPAPADNLPKKNVSPANMNEVQMEEVADGVIIHFPYKSTRKEDNASIDAYLANLARQLVTSSVKVTITGHTDFVGEPAENYQFGLLRAQGIRDILIKKGVPSKQITCKSSGDKKPVSTNDTAYGRYLNRRVEIKLN